MLRRYFKLHHERFLPGPFVIDMSTLNVTAWVLNFTQRTTKKKHKNIRFQSYKRVEWYKMAALSELKRTGEKVVVAHSKAPTWHPLYTMRAFVAGISRTPNHHHLSELYANLLTAGPLYGPKNSSCYISDHVLHAPTSYFAGGESYGW
jgi:hypothetical protein